MKNLGHLILMLTRRCNLSCAYCYLGDNKTEAIPNGSIDMPVQTIDRVVHLLKMAADSSRLLSGSRIQITGGEPLMVPDLLTYTIREIKRVATDIPISLQTNATLINEFAADLIKREKIDLGVSLDGDLSLQNTVRGRAADTYRGLQLLEKEQIPFNVTCVVSSANVDQLYRLGLALSCFSMARGIGFDLLVQKGSALNSDIQPAVPEKLGLGIHKLKAALKMVNQGRERPIVIREQEKIKSIGRSKTQTAFCHAANGQSLAVTPGGDLYPCSQTAFDPSFFYQNLSEVTDLSDIGKKDIFHDLGRNSSRLTDFSLTNDKENHCSTCPLQNLCPGECPSRLYYNAESKRTSLTCTLYQSLASKQMGSGQQVQSDKG